MGVIRLTESPYVVPGAKFRRRMRVCEQFDLANFQNPKGDIRPSVVILDWLSVVDLLKLRL